MRNIWSRYSAVKEPMYSEERGCRIMKIHMEEFTGKCGCGREHKLAVEEIYLEEGAKDRGTPPYPVVLTGSPCR